MGASVLINSCDTAMIASLKSRLRSSDVRLVISQPGRPFMAVARRERPAIAVLDAVDERVDAAQMEIELLKELRQDVRIIVISRKPSQQDAWVVERGVFFYMAAPALAELARVIEAAADGATEPRKAKTTQS